VKTDRTKRPLRHLFSLLGVPPVWLSCVSRTRNSWQIRARFGHYFSGVF